MTPSHLLTHPLLLAPGVSICARQAESWAGTRWGGSPPLLAAFPRTGKGRQVADALALLGEAPRAAAYVKVKANPRGARWHLALVLCTSVLPPSRFPGGGGSSRPAVAALPRGTEVLQEGCRAHAESH